uniref:Uncharacterized protein n=1 Tax=Physcomitrium patens TaxID=3218 RepID=A0A2K1KHG3_PHYPA|nr:hypothetical protein PHYPA_009598 [Physcomitrium patens]
MLELKHRRDPLCLPPPHASIYALSPSSGRSRRPRDGDQRTTRIVVRSLASPQTSILRRI